MAALKLQKLRELIRKSYEDGYAGCLELADEYTEEIINLVQLEMQQNKIAGSGEWRIWKIEELKQKPFGTLFEHSRLGQGWIDGRTEKDKCMTFTNGEHGYFMQQVDPWDEPLREIGVHQTK
jgi:hypothetical protein